METGKSGPHSPLPGKKAAPASADAVFSARNKTECLLSLLLAHLGEALAAVDGTVGLGLEGNLCLAAATCAGSGEELTGATGAVLAGITACLAALGLVLETALCVEFLLACGENELLTTFFAN